MGLNSIFTLISVDILCGMEKKTLDGSDLIEGEWSLSLQARCRL